MKRLIILCLLGMSMFSNSTFACCACLGATAAAAPTILKIEQEIEVAWDQARSVSQSLATFQKQSPEYFAEFVGHCISKEAAELSKEARTVASAYTDAKSAYRLVESDGAVSDKTKQLTKALISITVGTRSTGAGTITVLNVDEAINQRKMVEVSQKVKRNTSRSCWD